MIDESTHGPAQVSDAGDHDGPVPRSVGRAFDLLEIVVEAGEVNLTTAAERAGLTPTTALRHLRALETRGYVHRDRDGVFSAGPTLLRLASAAHDGGPLARLIAAAQPVLDDLRTDRRVVVPGDRRRRPGGLPRHLRERPLDPPRRMDRPGGAAGRHGGRGSTHR